MSRDKHNTMLRAFWCSHYIGFGTWVYEIIWFSSTTWSKIDHLLLENEKYKWHISVGILENLEAQIMRFSSRWQWSLLSLWMCIGLYLNDVNHYFIHLVRIFARVRIRAKKSMNWLNNNEKEMTGIIFAAVLLLGTNWQCHCDADEVFPGHAHQARRGWKRLIALPSSSRMY